MAPPPSASTKRKDRSLSSGENSDHPPNRPVQPDRNVLPHLLKPPNPSGTVLFNGFLVKESTVPILERVYKKHGDVGGRCKLESAVLRTFFMETLAEVVQLMLKKTAGELKQEDVTYVKEALANLEWNGFSVEGWLKPRAEKLAAILEKANRQSQLRRRVQELRWEMATREAELQECQKELDLSRAVGGDLI